MKEIFKIITLLSTLLLVSCSGQFYYTVQMANYGKYGITFVDYPGNYYPKYLGPGIPGVHGDFSSLNDFYGNRSELPDKPITIAWQLNELENCKDIRGPIASYDPIYPGKYTRKMGCEWKPILGKIYRKTIDIKKLAKESEATKHIGEREGGFFSMTGKKVMLISLIFIDDTLDIHIGTHAGNPWAKLSEPNRTAIALQMD